MKSCTYSSWKDDQIIELFKFIEEKKEKHQSLLSIFKEFAILHNRKPNSVRNYYYLELGELQQNQGKLKRLNIDLSKHEKLSQVRFEQTEEQEIVKNILMLNSQGKSVRKACLELAQGDLTKMIRYQNKYRNILKNDPEMINKIARSLQVKGVSIAPRERKTKPDNVFVMPKQNTAMSDKDIEALFMGLVRLVKRVAAEQAEQKQILLLRQSNLELEKANALVAIKEDKIEKLNKTTQSLRKENLELKTKLQNARIDSISNKKSKKMQKLEHFASALNKNQGQKLKA